MSILLTRFHLSILYRSSSSFSLGSFVVPILSNPNFSKRRCEEIFSFAVIALISSISNSLNAALNILFAASYANPNPSYCGKD